jgi:aminoglycoside 6-adenylyltransferase
VSRVAFRPDPSGVLERVVAWAQNDGAVSAALLLGSQARRDHPADDWSDTDLILVVDDPDALTSDASWPSRFGEVAITFSELTLLSERERRVLYADGTDVDVLPMSRDRMERYLTDPHALLALGRGHRALVDKIGIFTGLDRRIAEAQEAAAERAIGPDASAFENLVSDFWYHAVWAARKLRRGELWVAHSCVDGYLKQLLLRVIEWRATGLADATDTWFSGRFMERWADQAVLEGLGTAYGHHDSADVRRALKATMDLFRSLAMDLAAGSRLPYPSEADAAATAFVEELLTV